MFHRTRTVLAAIALLSTPGALAAHEGHGPILSLSGLAHWFFQPTHMAGTLLFLGVASIVVWGATRVRRTDSARIES